MCHLSLLLPLIALPIFWLVPLTPASLIYGAVLLVSVWTYWYVMQSMRRPIVAGKEELLLATGRVLNVRGKSAQIWVHGEIWSAVSSDRLKVNDVVEVLGVDGLRLKVLRFDPASNSARTTHRTPEFLRKNPGS
jgi:membrane protein implicated in regulation of membrane protease activity